MSVTIPFMGPPFAVTTDEYSDPNPAVFDFGGTPYVWGYLNISGNPVLVSLLVGADRGQTDWTIDYPVYSSFLPLSAGGARPGGRGGDAIWGIRVRALTAGNQADISGAFFQAGETGIVPGASGGTASCPCGSGGGALETTDGIIDVNPTTKLVINDGLALTNPNPGEADLAVSLESLDGSITITPYGPAAPIDLSVNFPAPPATGDYIFVAEHETNGAAADLLFSGIPQDARHLVIFLEFGFASQVPWLTFNGDSGTNYQSLLNTLQDSAGVLTSVDTSSGPGDVAIKMDGMDLENCRAVITIPYYRSHRPVGSGSGVLNGRSCEIESWDQTVDDDAGTTLVRHVKQTGWWLGSHSGPGDPAITSINLNTQFGVARASLYKIL